MVNYKISDHTADIGFEALGQTKEELFANSVAALFDLILDRQFRSEVKEEKALPKQVQILKIF
jgi:SHS2 domain-containing protein